jgi:uncharacterized protein
VRQGGLEIRFYPYTKSGETTKSVRGGADLLFGYHRIECSTFSGFGVRGGADFTAMAAIIEAVCYLDVPLDRIDILSIGTTEEPFTVKRLARSGAVRWGIPLIRLLMNAQVESSVQHAERLVGEARFLRVNTVTNPGMYSLDGSKEIEDLITLGNRRASDPTILYQIKSRFLNGVASVPWK